MAYKILVIEDNSDWCEMQAEWLESQGYVVTMAGCGYAGMVAAKRERPDCIVCDLKMPHGNGYFVVDQMKKSVALRDVPIIATTCGILESEIEAQAAGFDRLVSKTFRSAELLLAIKEQLHAASHRYH